MTTGLRPICLDCKRRRVDAPGFTCDAFPDEIPNDIIMSGFDHRKPHDGDHGLQFLLADGQEESLNEWLDLIGWPKEPAEPAKKG